MNFLRLALFHRSLSFLSDDPRPCTKAQVGAGVFGAARYQSSSVLFPKKRLFKFTVFTTQAS